MHNALLPITEIIDWERRRVYSHNGSGAAPIVRGFVGARERETGIFLLFFLPPLSNWCEGGKKRKKRGKVSPRQLFDGQINVEGREGASDSFSVWLACDHGINPRGKRPIFSFLLLSGKASVVGTKCEPSIFVFLLPSLRNERQELAI